jgi:hypothetical protein
VGTPVEQQRLEPGLQMRTNDDPAQHARFLAAELGGELCATSEQAERVISERRPLLSLDAECLDRLRALAVRVARAQRIVDGTVDRATIEVGERLADSGSGIAIHQSTVRDRAEAVVAARAALAAAEEQARLEEARFASLVSSTPDPEPVVADPSPATPVDDAPAAARRRRFLGFRRRGGGRKYREDTSESTSILQQVAASTDQAFGQRRAHSAREDSLVLLTVQRDRAHEDVRVAERMWTDLAGETSVDDVEAVVRRFDPQHQDALKLAQETIGVRAVSSLLQRALDEWSEGWRAAGCQPPSSADQAGIDEMIERACRPVVLVADATALASEVAAAAPAAPVVVVGASAS